MKPDRKPMDPMFLLKLLYAEYRNLSDEIHDEQQEHLYVNLDLEHFALVVQKLRAEIVRLTTRKPMSRTKAKTSRT